MTREKNNQVRGEFPVDMIGINESLLHPDQFKTVFFQGIRVSRPGCKEFFDPIFYAGPARVLPGVYECYLFVPDRSSRPVVRTGEYHKHYFFVYILLLLWTRNRSELHLKKRVL